MVHAAPWQADHVVGKIDGIAIGLRYVDGKLSEAQTRKSRCAMELIESVHSIPKQLKRKSVALSRSTTSCGACPRTRKIPERRNRSLQSLRGSTVSVAIFFCAYRLIGSLTNESQAMEDLRRHGFDVPNNCPPNAEVCKLYEQWREGHVSERQQFNNKLFKSWPTDGVVAKVFDQKLQRSSAQVSNVELGHRIEQWHRLN